MPTRGNMTCIGASVHIKREKRSTKSGGGIPALSNERLLGFIKGLFSQVYDVLPIDGVRNDILLNNEYNSDQLHELFLKDVGKCAYDEKIIRDNHLPVMK